MENKKEFEIVRHTAMSNLEIFFVEMTARSPHGHDDLEIGIILEGGLNLFTENEQYILQKGDIYIINRYQVHSFQKTDSPNLILAFQIHTDFYRRTDYQLSSLRFDTPVIPAGPLRDSLYQMLLSCAHTYFNALHHNGLRCSGIMMEVLYQLLTSLPCTSASEKECTTAQNNSHRLNRITSYIAEHYMEHISLNDIACLENITTYHASHFIKKMLGISFQEYLGNVRFEHALRLITQTNLNILDICLETGISSSRYLNQMFQNAFGYTVKEYRRLPEKPCITSHALPTGNIQNRYSSEKSVFTLSMLSCLENPTYFSTNT